MCADHQTLYDLWRCSGHRLAGRVCGLIRRQCRSGYNCGEIPCDWS